jgi:hypothetical protein
MRTINEIIIHCADTPRSWMAGRRTSEKVAEIRRWHVEERGWKDIGYHYVIDVDGTVAEGRPVAVAGAHVAGHNSHSIGICLIGGKGGAATDKFSDHFTPEQERALIQLVARLKSEYGDLKLSGHNQYAAKACPCFDVPTFFGEADAKRTSVSQSTTVQASSVQIATAVGGGVSAVAALDGTAQLVAVAVCGVVLLAGLWIMKERLKKWANGDR